MDETEMLDASINQMRKVVQVINDCLGIEFRLKDWGPEVGGTMKPGEMRKELFPLEITWPKGSDESLSFHKQDLELYVAGNPAAVRKIEEELRTHLERIKESHFP